MTILHLLTKTPDLTVYKIIAEQRKMAEVIIVDLRVDKEYDEIVDRIAAADKVISW